MSRILYFDTFSGISGDMVLGAFLDLGLPLRELERALGSLTFGGYRSFRSTRSISTIIITITTTTVMPTPSTVPAAIHIER